MDVEISKPCKNQRCVSLVMLLLLVTIAGYERPASSCFNHLLLKMVPSNTGLCAISWMMNVLFAGNSGCRTEEGIS